MRLPLAATLGVLFGFALLTFYPLRRLAVTGFVGLAQSLEHWDENGDE